MIKVLKKIWNEFICGGYWPGISSVIIVYSALKITDIQISSLYYLLVFLLSFIAYSFDRYVDNKKQVKLMILPVIIAVVTLLILLVFLGNMVLSIIGVTLVILGIFYNIFLKALTKKFVGFKNIFVALIFPSGLLLSIIATPSSSSVLLNIYFFFVVRLFINTSYGDIKDINEDEAVGMKTFAVTMGKQNLLRNLVIINFLSLLLVIIGVKTGILPASMFLYIVSVIYAHIYLKYSMYKNVKFDSMSTYIADGEPVLWLLLGILGGML